MKLLASLLVLSLIGFTIASIPCGSWTGECYRFANVLFDQSGTFDTYAPLSVGSYGGKTATFQPVLVTRLPTTASSVLYSEFPDSSTKDASFNGLASIGSTALNDAVANTDTNPALTRNLILGTGIVTIGSNADRAGFQLGYTGRALQNLPGPDLMFTTVNQLFEPSVGMVQVLIAFHGWSDWVYTPPTFSAPLENGQAGFVTLVDLDSFGVTENSGYITELRFVNMAEIDRVQNSTGVGVVLPQDDGVTKPVNYPIAPSIANYGTLGKNDYAPTALYFAAMHQTLSLNDNIPFVCVEDDEDCDDDIDEEGTKVSVFSRRRNKKGKNRAVNNRKAPLNMEEVHQQKGPIASFNRKVSSLSDMKSRNHQD